MDTVLVHVGEENLRFCDFHVGPLPVDFLANMGRSPRVPFWTFMENKNVRLTGAKRREFSGMIHVITSNSLVQ